MKLRCEGFQDSQKSKEKQSASIYPKNNTPGKNIRERAAFATARFTICILHTIEEFNASREKRSLGLKSPLTAAL